NLGATTQQLHEALSTRPSVLASPHRKIPEGGIAVGASVLHRLAFDGDRSLEQLWVPLSESDPFRLALIEAEVAARPRAPLIVRGRPESGVGEYAEHAIVV